MVHANEKVSIVIPCFNQEKFIAPCVESCLNQTYQDIEIIVVDDGSIDRSRSIVKSYNNERIILLESTHTGAQKARNRGFEAASGRYVKFLDSDDTLDHGSIAAQVKAIQLLNADVIYSDWRHIVSVQGKADRLMDLVQWGPINDFPYFLLTGKWLPPYVFLYKKDFLKTSQLAWDESFQVQQDFDFIGRVVLERPITHYVEGLAGCYRIHGNPRVSKAPNKDRAMAAYRVVEHMIGKLKQRGELSARHVRAACGYYLSLAKNVSSVDPALFNFFLTQIKNLDPTYQSESRMYALLVKFFGYRCVETCLKFKRHLLNKGAKTLA